jgi:hypothetical protein
VPLMVQWIMNTVPGSRVYNRLHAISTQRPYHLHANGFDFTLLGLSKSDLEVVRSVPQQWICSQSV